MLDRVFILMSSPVSLLLTCLLQLLLCFGVCEAETKLDAIDLIGDIVEVSDDLLGNITTLKSSGLSRKRHHVRHELTEQSRPPCRCLCLAHGRSLSKPHDRV